MPIAHAIADQLKNASWIRRMFEEGVRLKRERGEDAVCDFSLGNPDMEPPAAVLASLRRAAASDRRGQHGYMPNAGYPQVRAAVAAQLARETGLAFAAEDVFMTSGAAGACNVILKSVLDPGDEVIVLAPYFPEYSFYVTNHAGRVVTVETDAEFLPDPDRIAAAITPRTRALILNTPNNPTGRVYPESSLRAIQQLLDRAAQPILVISDEPYKSFVYDGRCQPPVAASIANTTICSSWSKSLGLAGERIGYLALSPLLPDRDQLRAACAFANRILGYINAPAIWQHVILETLDESLDAAAYEEKRNLLCDALLQIGYEVRQPEGAFYIFLRTPIPDDVEFSALLAQQGILAVPGTGFGRSGYIRLSLTLPLEQICRAIPGFARVFQTVLTHT